MKSWKCRMLVPKGLWRGEVGRHLGHHSWSHPIPKGHVSGSGWILSVSMDCWAPEATCGFLCRAGNAKNPGIRGSFAPVKFQRLPSRIKSRSKAGKTPGFGNGTFRIPVLLSGRNQHLDHDLCNKDAGFSLIFRAGA